MKDKVLGVNGGGGGNAEEQGGAVGSEEPATCEAPENKNLKTWQQEPDQPITPGSENKMG